MRKMMLTFVKGSGSSSEFLIKNGSSCKILYGYIHYGCRRWCLKHWNMFLKLKSVVIFLKIIVNYCLMIHDALLDWTKWVTRIKRSSRVAGFQRSAGKENQSLLVLQGPLDIAKIAIKGILYDMATWRDSENTLRCLHKSWILSVLWITYPS